MTKKNRRFPFEENRNIISLENFSTTEQKLYPMIRQYSSLCRQNKPIDKPVHIQDDLNDSTDDNYQLNQLINYLKQQRDDSKNVDTSNLSALRDHNIQHWKQVKYEWQKHYQAKNKKQQELFDQLIKKYHR